MLKFAATAIVAASVAHSAIHVTGNSSAQQSHSRADLRPCNFALDREPLTRNDHIATFVNRGIIYFHREQYNLALAGFGRALDMDADQPEAMLNMATASPGINRKGPNGIMLSFATTKCGCKTQLYARNGYTPL